ncbi:MAG TPA: DUF2156 domain-containing protein [Polyangiaceae bacterium]
MSVALHTERERVLSLVHRHGWNATAFQTLESGYCYSFHGDDACVAYVDTGAAWVVAGAPIAEHAAIARVAAEFVARARAAGRRCCFFATEERLQAAAGGALRSLCIGEQPVWDPREWPVILAGHRSLREQLRRARAKGVRTREVSPTELEASPTQEAIKRLIRRWLATRGMAGMGFLVRVEPFEFPSHRRCFVAELDERVVGFAGVVPIPARSGWFIEDLLRDPHAPNGSGELLVDAVMSWAARGGCDWLTLGLAPLAGDVAPPLRFARKSTAFLYDFQGLRSFKAKLRPQSWSPIYISHPPSQGALISIADALIAFTRGGLLRFGLRSFLRGPNALIRALAFLLVPWTLLLMIAPSQRYFMSAWIKWAWVGFDALLALALFHWLQKPTKGLLTALAVAVTADAALTSLQALLWNVRQVQGTWDVLLIAVGCAAPLIAATVLWGARFSRFRAL